MTLRLVTLMSVVLLLCLAGFGLSVSHYQDQVMEEVAQTAAAVGQATLRTFESRTVVDVARFGQPGQPMVWHSPDDCEQTDCEGAIVGEMVVAGRLPGGRGALIEHFGAGAGGGAIEHDVVVRELHREAHGDNVSVLAITCEYDEGGDKRCVTTRDGEELAEAGKQDFVFRIEDVRAEPDPAEGLVLTIPGLNMKRIARDEGDDTPMDPVRAGVAPFPVEELRLPIPAAYQDLFDALRGRSLFLFLGIFVVGTVLSAGLASRFTRPIRRLDAAIHRLSEGDLETRVDVRGKDEIARLGRAFNEMTSKLRTNRERARELTRREKLSALGRLAAGVAHDVRNPLHSIGLTLQHMDETCRPENGTAVTEFDRSMNIIRCEIGRLDQLVGNFLRFASSDERELQRVDVAGLLEETARLVRKEAEWREIDVQLRIEGEIPEIRADGEAIRSSVLNLVLNSFEAMPRGGTLVLALCREGQELVLDVRDDGQGVPAEDQERVFDFGYTTREGGNGLGLAMVHQCIVEDHGGRVALESQPGSGTRVRIVLPVTLPEPQAEETR